MFIIHIGGSEVNVMVVELEPKQANSVHDPRHMDSPYKFSFSVNGTTLTITRTDKDAGWEHLKLRAYLPTQVIPDFTSTVYTYHGLMVKKPPMIPRKSSFIRPLTPSRELLSMVAYPWCRLKYPTPSK